MSRNYGHNDYASLPPEDESLLPVERPGDAGSGAPESASASGELPDDGGEAEVSTEEAAEVINAAEVLIAEREKYEKAEKDAFGAGYATG